MLLLLQPPLQGQQIPQIPQGHHRIIINMNLPWLIRSAILAGSFVSFLVPTAPAITPDYASLDCRRPTPPGEHILPDVPQWLMVVRRRFKPNTLTSKPALTFSASAKVRSLSKPSIVFSKVNRFNRVRPVAIPKRRCAWLWQCQCPLSNAFVSHESPSSIDEIPLT